MKRNRLTNLIFALLILAIVALAAGAFVASMSIGELAKSGQDFKWTAPFLVAAFLVVVIIAISDRLKEKHAAPPGDYYSEYVWIDPNNRDSLNQLRRINARQNDMMAGRIPSNRAGAKIIVQGSPSQIGHVDFEYQMLIRDFIKNDDSKFAVEFAAQEDPRDRWQMGKGLKIKTR